MTRPAQSGLLIAGAVEASLRTAGERPGRLASFSRRNMPKAVEVVRTVRVVSNKAPRRGRDMPAGQDGRLEMFPRVAGLGERVVGQAKRLAVVGGEQRQAAHLARGC